MADELGFLETCGIDIASPKFPIPVQPAQDFPALMHVIQVRGSHMVHTSDCIAAG